MAVSRGSSLLRKLSASRIISTRMGCLSTVKWARRAQRRAQDVSRRFFLPMSRNFIYGTEDQARGLRLSLNSPGRHARKIRRREKAAILNSRPPPSPAHSAHAHPAPKRRSPESDSEAGRALPEILSGERRTVSGRAKRRKMQPRMDLIRRWKPENVVTSRLTVSPPCPLRVGDVVLQRSCTRLMVSS